MPATKNLMGASLAESFGIQFRVIRALIIREALSRFGRATGGMFWVILEPLFLSCGVVGLWLLTRGSDPHYSRVGIIALALTGYSHIQLWRHNIFGASLSIRQGGWLLYHQNIHIFDVLLAKSILSSIGIFTSFVIAYELACLFELTDQIRDPFLVISAWGLDSIFCFSAALLIAGVSELSDTVERIIHPMMYLTMPLTGTFIMQDWLPPRAQLILNWSPLVNTCEMLRAGTFSESVKTTWSVSFVLVSSLAVAALALPVMNYARRQVEIS